MAKKTLGKARPGSTEARKVTRGPGKGDTVRFVANSSSAQQPGKLVPRKVVKDVPPRGTQDSLPKAKKKAAARKRLRSKMT